MKKPWRRSLGEEALAKKHGEAARKEVIKQKKAREVFVGVTKGAELLRALELNGEKYLASFTLNDLKVLLSNADPQGNEAKIKNKAEGLIRVRALASVESAISRSDLAVAVDVTPIPLATPIPPLAVVALFPEPPIPDFQRALSDLISSFGSFGSSGVVQDAFIPVAHQAP